MRAITKIALSLAALSALGSAYAAETDIDVTASIAGNCAIISAQDINFGQLNPAAATDKTANSDVVFACTNATNWTLGVGNGQNYDAGSSQRRMKLGADYLPYALQNSSFTGTSAGFGVQDTVNLQASILAASYRDLPAGNFADTLHLTLLP